jgi:NitT/TauT family transport system substrate-binding protein
MFFAEHIHIMRWLGVTHGQTCRSEGIKMATLRNVRLGSTALLFGAAVLAACPAAAQTKVTFSLDGKIEGPDAPFLVAIDRGYFKAEGLDVMVNAAAGSPESIGRVASTTYDMGLADINTLIKFRDANPKNPVKAVFVVYNKPAYAIIGRKSRGVAKPKDLEGKKLGAPAADPAYAQWKIFVQANGIDASKVKVENVGIPVREPMLQNGQVDAITGLSLFSFVNLKGMGVPADDIVVMLMADHGVELYGNSIIVNPKFAAEKPDAAKGFLRALLKGLKYTVRNPSRAIESVLKRNDAAQKTIELERLRMAVQQNILTPEVKANGYGSVDNARLAKAIEQIGLTYTYKNAKPKPDDVFDSSFLPAENDRKAN